MKRHEKTVIITAELQVDDDIVSNFREFRKDGDSIINHLIGELIVVKSGLYENSASGCITKAIIKTIPRKP